MDKVEIDVIQNEKGQLIAIDQDGRRISRVKSIQVNQVIGGANEVTLTFLQHRGGELISGSQVEADHGRT